MVFIILSVNKTLIIPNELLRYLPESAEDTSNRPDLLLDGEIPHWPLGVGHATSGADQATTDVADARSCNGHATSGNAIPGHASSGHATSGHATSGHATSGVGQIRSKFEEDPDLQLIENDT